MSTWSVGRKLGRTLYRDGACVGMVDTPEIAEAIVRAMNGDGNAGAIEFLRRQKVVLEGEMSEAGDRRDSERCGDPDSRLDEVSRAIAALGGDPLTGRRK